MLSIPDLATQLVDNSILDVKDVNCRTLLLTGSSFVGKTILLNSFLDKSDAPRETLVLEYSYARKSTQKEGFEKMICHIWEYGGKIDILRNVLPSIPIKGKSYYCVMIDLSKIKNIWPTLETCIKAMEISFKDSKEHPELFMIGGKYDLFKNYDAEIKKDICISLRSVALLYGGHLMFYSLKDQQLAKRAKEMLHGIGFGNGVPSREKNVNFTKPLCIPKGTDSWDNIGGQQLTFEQIKVRHISRFPGEPFVAEIDATVLHKAHQEPLLDSKLASKYHELQNIETNYLSINDYLIGLN